MSEATGGRLDRVGPQEPAGMIEHRELRCPSCAHGFALEKPNGNDGTAYSCATYWRGKHGTCWVIASPRTRFVVRPIENQLAMF